MPNSSSSGIPGSSSPAISESSSLVTLTQNMLTLLSDIQTQLQTISSQQNQLQQSFNGYAQFQIMSTYPSSSFPGSSGLNVSPVSNNPMNAMGVNSLNYLLDGSNSKKANSEWQKSQVLNDTVKNLGQPLSDSVLSDLSNYIGVVNNTSQSMTAAQALQLTNQLLLLNTKAVYLQYQENRRLEALLGSQLFIAAQQKIQT
jgi:hypothetical protein